MSNTKGVIALAMVILLIAVVSVLVSYHSGIVPIANAQVRESSSTWGWGGGCSVGTLYGKYGNLFQYLNPTDPNTVPAPLGTLTHMPGAGLALASFDGRGNFFETLTISHGGLMVRGSASGTYTVNRDCTGSITATFDWGDSFQLAVVVVDAGKEVFTVGDQQGSISHGIMRKQ